MITADLAAALFWLCVLLVLAGVFFGLLETLWRPRR